MRPLGARDGARAADARTHARARARRGCGGRGARARIQLAAGRPRTFSSSAPDAMAFSCSQSLASPEARVSSVRVSCHAHSTVYNRVGIFIRRTHINNLLCFSCAGLQAIGFCGSFRDASTSRRAGSRAGRRRRRTWTSVTGTVSTNVSGVFKKAQTRVLIRASASRAS
jgi:hypothetical protein